MRKLLFIIIFFLLAISCYSQGFDWQYSARMPFENPRLFHGLVASYEYNFHNADFSLSSANVECCQMKEGNGNGFRIGYSSEYWYNDLVAFSGILSYRNTQAKFSQKEIIPTKEYDIFREYQYTSSIGYISLDLSAKHRLFESHLYVSAGLEFALFVHQGAEYKHKILSPSWEYFKDGDKTTQVRDLDLPWTPEQNTLNIRPRFRLGYDLNLGLGTYASPSFTLFMPIFNSISEQDWTMYTYSFEFRVYKSF